MYWLKVSDRKSQTEKSISKEEGHWNWKLRMEKFSNNRVTKKNSIAKIWQFSVWGRSHIFPLIIFFPDFSLTFKVIFSFPWRFKTTTTKKTTPFPEFPWSLWTMKESPLKMMKNVFYSIFEALFFYLFPPKLQS